MPTWLIVVSLVALLCVRSSLAFFGFGASRVSTKLQGTSDDFLALEKKLLQKQNNAVNNMPVAQTVQETKVKAVEKKPVPQQVSKAAVSKAQTFTVVEAKKQTTTVPVAKVAQTAAPVVQTKTIVSTAPATSTADYFTGITLGVAPYLLIPVLAFNAVKGLIRKPKPLPKVETKPPRRMPYTKPLSEGAKEGIDELLSGKSSPELELTRKGIKLSASAFAVAGTLTGVLFAVNQDQGVRFSKSP